MQLIFRFCIIEEKLVSEAELLQRIKDNPAHFSELFNLYYPQIFGYIFRRVGNFDDSADIAAESFYNAYCSIHRFSYRGIAVKVWLYRIATNQVNLYFRSQKKRKALFERRELEHAALLQEYLLEDKKDMETEMQQHEQFIAVLSRLKTLPVAYQEVIALRYFEGKELKEICLILNMKEGTIKSLLSRGVEKLRIQCNQK